MNQVIISPLNGIRFVPANVTPNPRFNRQQFDNEWYYDLIYSFQKKVFYAQPVQNKDYLSLQILANAGATITLKLLTCGGITKATKKFTEFSGVTPTINGIASSYYMLTDFQVWSNIASGIYYLSIEIAFSDSTTVLYLSEPLSVEEKHENTVLIEYQNSYNKDNILFEQTYQKFCLRVPGAMKLSPVSTKNVFQDQGYSSVLLSGTAYRKWDFTFGGEGNYLPEYMFDMLNHIFAIDHIRIDGKNFTVIDDSSLELENVDLYPLTTAKISLGEAENMDSFRHLSGTLIMGQIPTVPFVLFNLKLEDSGFTDYFFENPLYAPNASGLQTIIDSFLNPDLQNKGLSGNFSIYTNPVTSIKYLSYNLGSDESFSTWDWVILTKSFQTAMSTVQSFYSAKPKYDIQGNGNHVALIDTSQNINYGFGILNGLTTIDCKGFLLQNETREMSIFYDEPSPITYLRLYGEPSVQNPLLNVTLSGLQEVIINDAQQLNAFNVYPILVSSKDTLFRVQINNTSLSAHPMVTPDPNQVSPTPIWKNLKQFYLMGSNMSDAEADQFAINVALYASAYYGGAAPPEEGKIQIYSTPTPGYTSTSQNARNFLTSLNWSIH